MRLARLYAFQFRFEPQARDMADSRFFFRGTLLSVLVLLYVAVRVAESRTSEHLKVRLPHGGVLIGRHMTSHKGRSVRGFMGVPYAKPPLGELRFKSPVPFGAWVGDRKAIDEPSMCVQRDPYRRDPDYTGSEDCLYLNVYVPEEPKTDEPLPVMLWFHGGGFMCGTGKHSFYGSDFLMDHDVIFIGANYRLGPLGFLSTETVDCPGNFGLKDQVEILKWIQENIASFGGNPDSVTIFGESAGGASVTYHMMSPLSRGLFHRGIAMSGTYFNPWAQPAHKGVAAKRARQLSKIMGCGQPGHGKWDKVLSCLREKPADRIVATIYDLFEWDTDPMVPYPPVVEPVHPDAFITAHPRSLVNPHGFSLPLMIGATTEEGLLKTAPIFGVPGLLDDFKRNFDRAMPIMLYYDHHAPQMQERITEQLEEFYFKEGHNFDQRNHKNLTDLLSDAWFINGIDEYMRLRLNANQDGRPQKAADTYVYLFEHKGSASFSELFRGGPEVFYGVSHADDLQYIFPVGREIFYSAAPTKADIEVREAMLKMWTSFARGSDPTPPDSKLPHWTPSQSYPVSYVHIAKSKKNPAILRQDVSFLQERSNFWYELAPHLDVTDGKDSTRTEL